MFMSRKTIKKLSKTMIRETKPSPLLVALIYIAFTQVLSILSNKLSRADEFMDIMANISINAAQGNTYFYDWPKVTFPALAVVFLIFLFNYLLTFGFSMYSLNVSRKQKSGPENLFDGFQMFFKVIWLNVVMGILVSLWSLLLIFPGILASIRYSQALFVLIDNPEMGAFECIARSKELMRGKGGDYFTLVLSFFPWFLIVNALTFYGNSFGFNWIAVMVMTNIIQLWLTPYLRISQAIFYNSLLGEEQIGPITEEGI